MRKFFIGIVLIAIIAASVFAFAACDDNENDIDLTPSWSVNTEWLDTPLALLVTQESSTGVLSFVDETRWRIDVGGGAAKMGENSNWCQGTYYFADENGEPGGIPGLDPLVMLLFDTEAYIESNPDDENPEIYDPANIALVDPVTDEPVDKNIEVVYYPDENGVYIVKARGINEFAIMGAGAYKDEITMTYEFYPPQDGTLGLGGAPAPLPPEGKKDYGPIIGGVVGGVAAVVIIVVIVVLVKKNKKKKAAQAAAQAEQSDAQETPPEE